jgi:hypothetical protein
MHDLCRVGDQGVWSVHDGASSPTEPRPPPGPNLGGGRLQAAEIPFLVDSGVVKHKDNVFGMSSS